MYDILILTAAFISLIFSELPWFKGEKEAGIFIDIWVPSNLGFAILLKLINKDKMTQLKPFFAGIITILFGIAFILALKRMSEIK